MNIVFRDFPNHLCVFLFAVLTLPFASVKISASPVSSFHIGNSLTFDARIHDGLRRLAKNAGHELSTGYHIRGGNPLRTIAADPGITSASVPPPLGTWDVAFEENNFDFLTLQPFTKSTGKEELDAAQTLISASQVNSPDIKIFYYSAYPEISAGFNYSEYWESPFTPTGQEELVFNRAYTQWLLERFPSNNTNIIPVGEVLNTFDRMARAGEISGFSSANELYRDNLHLNNVGRYLASLTFLTTMLDTDPTGIFSADFEPNISTFPSDRTLDPALQAIIQNVVNEGLAVSASVYNVPEPASLVLLTGLGVVLLHESSRRHSRCPKKFF